MKVVTAHTMQAIDQRTISEYGIPGRELMENAGRSCAEHIMAAYGTGKALKNAVVIAGKGNNGGDGYVIARHLIEKGWKLLVIVLAEKEKIAGDALTNLLLLPEDVLRFCFEEGELGRLYAEDIKAANVVVDAMLGVGLSSDLQGIYNEAVDLVNSAPGNIVAVDIPTGVHGTTGRLLGKAVKAELTVTFGFAKLGLVLYPGAECVGRLVVCDIGIPEHLASSAAGYEYLDKKKISPLIKRRDRQSHKGTYGNCLIIAGSTGMTGAAAITANSAVRSGAGIVTLAVPETLNPVLEVKTTEAITVPLADAGSGHLLAQAIPTIDKLLDGKSTVAIGPGIGRRQSTVTTVQSLVESVTLPMVVDADALFALAEDTSVLHRKKSQQMILTPHPGEMSRLLGSTVPDVEAIRISVAQEFAKKFGVYVVLKGARTIIASPDGRAAINSSGNPGMASGGMGDVLTGVISALLCQGYSAWDACCLGVFVHGLAGDMVAVEQGEIGMAATDLGQMLPYAFNRLLHLPYSGE